ncbi:GNAT family N-acetyltransferase [Anaerocolumna sedimenticola]|uniref:GNAT family N-acetyltransferase n=1 Tax=Anaerocolumna sedimenticola TaxID=2696063 RepID=A0A6P1TKZ6_9FIRM|nr:GNAT family N-acetyltransferase [Anaerocolumna sedimenticola]QHQ61890.1 GNAT family N-acetyltransferase [Anaerocolumna sedimenticola]
MICYRIADMDDIDMLTGLRLSMLNADGDLTAENIEKLGINTKQYMINGYKEKSYMVLVAEINREIIAMSGVTFYTLPPNDWCPNGKTAYIGNIYTLPEYRRNGIASKLLSLTVDEAKKTGCERIQLHGTDMGRPIYEKYGFEDSITSMAYYPFGKTGSKH